MGTGGLSKELVWLGCVGRDCGGGPCGHTRWGSHGPHAGCLFLLSVRRGLWRVVWAAFVL